jgi:hypothetical protein
MPPLSRSPDNYKKYAHRMTLTSSSKNRPRSYTPGQNAHFGVSTESKRRRAKTKLINFGRTPRASIFRRTVFDVAALRRFTRLKPLSPGEVPDKISLEERVDVQLGIREF